MIGIESKIIQQVTSNFVSGMSSKKNQKQNQPSQQQKRQAQLLQMKKADSSILKQQIFRLKQQLQDIANKKKQLKQLIEKNKENNTKQTFKLENELKIQEEGLVQIQNTLNEKNNKYNEEIKGLMARFEQDGENVRIKHEKEIQEKKKELEKMKEKVEYLKKYPQRKKKYETSIEELNARLEKMRQQQQKDLNNIRNQHQKQREQQEKDTEVEMKKIKDSEVQRLEQKMTTEQFIKKQNQVMQTEIKLCEEQIEVLQKQCAELKRQIQDDKSQINENILGNQANQTYERSLRIIKLQGKLAKLKAYLTEQTSKLQKQYQDLDSIYMKQQQQTDAKISKVQGWLRIKQRDLKKVKACSQMVLNQRSNLESYLLEVFYEHPEIDYKDQKNVNKILRFLFAKINSKKPPINYKNFLPQSCKSINSSDFRA